MRVCVRFMNEQKQNNKKEEWNLSTTKKAAAAAAITTTIYWKWLRNRLIILCACAYCHRMKPDRLYLMSNFHLKQNMLSPSQNADELKFIYILKPCPFMGISLWRYATLLFCGWHTTAHSVQFDIFYWLIYLFVYTAYIYLYLVGVLICVLRFFLFRLLLAYCCFY